jgi:CRISPR/Cas system-associated endonuclease/helicase Cas3
MSQATLNEDELFGEAANEMRADVEAALADTRSALPDADAIWETEADNVLGVLNGLKGALDVGDAAEDLREAKKWFAMGQRADAFEDADDLAEEIAELEELIENVETAHEQVGELSATIPELKGSLDDAAVDEDEDEDEDED